MSYGIKCWIKRIFFKISLHETNIVLISTTRQRQFRKPSDKVYSDLYLIIYCSDVSALNTNYSHIIVKKTSKHINL